jgi:D-tyrosyl-tRNA(Tyr) deacylase
MTQMRIEKRCTGACIGGGFHYSARDEIFSCDRCLSIDRTRPWLGNSLGHEGKSLGIGRSAGGLHCCVRKNRLPTEISLKRVMRAVVQRVSQASVTVGGRLIGSIQRGLLVLVAVEDADTAEDIEWLSGKVVRLRIFNDEAGVMNRSVQEVGGEILVISQFTLFASTKKGNRPSYIRSARPEIAVPLYEKFMARVAEDLGKPVATGEFGADMQVSLVNDGPVTIIIDTKSKE